MVRKISHKARRAGSGEEKRRKEKDQSAQGLEVRHVCSHEMARFREQGRPKEVSTLRRRKSVEKRILSPPSSYFFVFFSTLALRSSSNGVASSNCSFGRVRKGGETWRLFQISLGKKKKKRLTRRDRRHSLVSM